MPQLPYVFTGQTLHLQRKTIHHNWQLKIRPCSCITIIIPWMCIGGVEVRLRSFCMSVCAREK
jgi:hypothetical protein